MTHLGGTQVEQIFQSGESEEVEIDETRSVVVGVPCQQVIPCRNSLLYTDPRILPDHCSVWFVHKDTFSVVGTKSVQTHILILSNLYQTQCLNFACESWHVVRGSF